MTNLFEFNAKLGSQDLLARGENGDIYKMMNSAIQICSRVEHFVRDFF